MFSIWARDLCACRGIWLVICGLRPMPRPSSLASSSCCCCMTIAPLRLAHLDDAWMNSPACCDSPLHCSLLFPKFSIAALVSVLALSLWCAPRNLLVAGQETERGASSHRRAKSGWVEATLATKLWQKTHATTKPPAISEWSCFGLLFRAPVDGPGQQPTDSMKQGMISREHPRQSAPFAFLGLLLSVPKIPESVKWR